MFFFETRIYQARIYLRFAQKFNYIIFKLRSGFTNLRNTLLNKLLFSYCLITVIGTQLCVLR